MIFGVSAWWANEAPVGGRILSQTASNGASFLMHPAIAESGASAIDGVVSDPDVAGRLAAVAVEGLSPAVRVLLAPVPLAWRRAGGGADSAGEMVSYARRVEESEPLGITYQQHDVASLPVLGAIDIVTAIWLFAYAEDEAVLDVMIANLVANAVPGGAHRAEQARFTESRPERPGGVL